MSLSAEPSGLPGQAEVAAGGGEAQPAGAGRLDGGGGKTYSVSRSMFQFEC